MSSLIDVNFGPTLPQTQPQQSTPDSASPPAPPNLTKAEASRKNGNKGKGPISREGKLRSSKNATVHGCSITRSTYSNQDFPGIKRITRNLALEFKPKTPAECALIDIMALARWQQLSIPQETAALINHTRDTQIADPSCGPALANANAIDKLHQQGNTLNHYHRYLVSAERRFCRAIRDLDFLRRNSHTLHELESAAAHEAYEIAPTAASTHPESAAEVLQDSNCDENVGLPNEPEHFADNNVLTNSRGLEHDEVYPQNAPQKDQNDLNSTAAKPLDSRDPWDALILIQQTLLNHPEAHRAVTEALVAAEKTA